MTVSSADNGTTSLINTENLESGAVVSELRRLSHLQRVRKILGGKLDIFRDAT